MIPLKTSYSAIQTYLRCPRSWYLGDYRGLAPVLDKRTGALGFGSRFHQALEAWGDHTVDDPVEAWHQLMAHEYAIAEQRGGEFALDELDKENALGLVMLEGYKDWYETEGEDEEYEVVAVEHQLRNELITYTPAGEEVQVLLYGKLDQILRHREWPEQFWVRDWKTTASLPETAKETLEMSPQPRIYKALLEQEYPGINIVGLRYTFFRKVQRTARAKPPFWFHYDLRLSDYNVTHHVNRVRAVAGQMSLATMQLDVGMNHEQVAPFNPGWWCRSCPFRNVCYVMQTTGMGPAEEMLADQFTSRDPLERYSSEAEQTIEVGGR